MQQSILLTPEEGLDIEIRRPPGSRRGAEPGRRRREGQAMEHVDDLLLVVEVVARHARLVPHRARKHLRRRKERGGGGGGRRSTAVLAAAAEARESPEHVLVGAVVPDAQDEPQRATAARRHGRHDALRRDALAHALRDHLDDLVAAAHGDGLAGEHGGEVVEELLGLQWRQPRVGVLVAPHHPRLLRLDVRPVRRLRVVPHHVLGRRLPLHGRRQLLARHGLPWRVPAPPNEVAVLRGDAEVGAWREPAFEVVLAPAADDEDDVVRVGAKLVEDDDHRVAGRVVERAGGLQRAVVVEEDQPAAAAAGGCGGGGAV
ncbi:Os09g0427551 [Oryza sativa Japonica Group]|uniref:Os09g0427551 protein n=1 Tax=Oryza sativa subsp. japonica TaxID=39947 RepID=A0A0N7KQU4_ORYSJ|nr:hypothetical protein EE612_047960 [Oryza sativa]BAT08186.1 Os09g0427551 [Oryza sativa Japonica Group]